MRPKEDPAAKAERERQQRLAMQERISAAQGSAADMTTDFGAVYGTANMPNQGAGRVIGPRASGRRPATFGDAMASLRKGGK